MDERLATAQALQYAKELRTLYDAERAQRRRAEEALARLEDSYAATVVALSIALELRDDLTGGHAERVAALALRLARRIAPELAKQRELEYGFLLHDVGKIGVPDSILLKPGPLDDDELRVMRRHPQLGEQVVAQVPGLEGVAREVVIAHHERWDGTGYPHGIAADEIPLAARIFAVVDAFDAMTNDRPYRGALSHGDALDRLAAGAGTHFDPSIVAAFLALARDESVEAA